MSNPVNGPGQSPVTRRRRVLPTVDEMVVIERLPVDEMLPVLVRPVRPGVDLVAWASAERDALRDRLHADGAVLFRGFSGIDRGVFGQLVEAVAGSALEYVQRSSPRRALGGNIYTSTEQPPDQNIVLHNEHSYSVNWPMRLFFYCETAPAAGGATPLADTRRILSRIPADVRQTFLDREYVLRRHNRIGMGLDWREVYQTDDRAEVESYCAAHDIRPIWEDDGSLTTTQVRPLIRSHPETGEEVWFNHFLFFNARTLDSGVREALTRSGDVSDLPNSTYYGDGRPVETAVVDAVRRAYDAELSRFTWQQGDILMIDNMLVAHGRDPFTPPRQILVAMAEPFATFQVVPAGDR